MKIIDSNVVAETVHSSKSLDDWLNSLKIGRSSSQDLEAQGVVLAVFQRMMDNKHYLLRDVLLEGLEMPIPMTLVGPSGIWVIYPSGLRGVYRTKGDAWEKIDDRQHAYVPTGENLLTRTSIMASTVKSHLAERGIRVPEVEGVVVFTNTGIHVETVRPLIRVVLVDALERFASGILQGRITYDPDQTQNIVDALVSATDELSEDDESQVGAAGDDQASADSAFHKTVKAGSERLDRIDNAFSKLEKAPFNSRQWIILGILMLINILILVGFVLYILFVN